VAELVFVGAIASTVGALLAISAAQHFHFASPDALSAHPREYVVANPLRALGLIAVGFAIAYGGAALVAIGIHPRAGASIRPGFSAWHFALAGKPGKFRVYATVELRDGRVLAGWAGAYTVEPEDPEKRELVLEGPVMVSRDEGVSFAYLRDNGIILQGQDILAISVQKGADPPRTRRRLRDRLSRKKD
jgi:hypothetical protein